MTALEAGAWVLGRYRGGDFYFPGVVQHVGNGAVTIGYDDGDRETLPAHLTKPYDWAVGSRIEAIWSGNGQWYAAEIIARTTMAPISSSASSTTASRSGP